MTQVISQNHPWKRQRELKKEDIPVQQYILETARTYDDLEERSLFIMAYLTGGRLTEIIPKKWLFINHYKKEFNEDKNKMTVAYNKNGSPIIDRRTRKWLDYPGLLKKNIVFTWEYGKQVMVVSMQNRKNPKEPRKRIPIPMEKEKELIGLLKEYLDRLESDQPLFDFGETKARRIISKAKMNPHFLRDIRLTHLVTMYDFGGFQLMKFAGWTTVDPAKHYVKMSMKDLIAKY